MDQNTTVSQEPVFALVNNNSIVIYPLSEADIYARNQPNETYYPCFKNIQPEYNLFCQYLVEKPVVVGTYVIVNYEIATIPIDHLFDELAVLRAEYGETFDISHVPLTLLASFEVSVTFKVTTLLNQFAATRRYGDINSLADYRDSPVEKYRNEGILGRTLRDTTWFQLETYLVGIMSGTVPLPDSWDDIAAVLPTLSWGDL